MFVSQAESLCFFVFWRTCYLLCHLSISFFLEPMPRVVCVCVCVCVCVVVVVVVVVNFFSFFFVSVLQT